VELPNETTVRLVLAKDTVGASPLGLKSWPLIVNWPLAVFSAALAMLGVLAPQAGAIAAMATRIAENR
jgi:hypothetical protein